MNLASEAASEESNTDTKPHLAEIEFRTTHISDTEVLFPSTHMLQHPTRPSLGMDCEGEEEPILSMNENEATVGSGEYSIFEAAKLRRLGDGAASDDSDETGSDDSLYEASHAKIRLAILNYAMHQFFALFWPQSSCASGPSDGCDISLGKDTDGNTTSNQASRSNGGTGKRKTDKRDEADADSDDEGSPKKKRSYQPRQSQRDVTMKLACPFFKNDIRFCSKGACFGPGWDTVHRVK